MAVRSRWTAEARGYLVAVVATAAGALVRVLSAELGFQAPFFPFVLAVLVTAWYGGLKPGLLTTALGAVLGVYLFAPPAYSSWPDFSGVTVTTALFVVIGVTASWLYEALHTARRRTEEKQRQLVQAEEQVRSVVNNVIDGIITIDKNGTVESFNLAAERLFGYPASEVIGKNVKVLMPEPYNAEHDKYILNFLRTGQAKIIGVGREVVGRRKDGSTFPMDLAVGEFCVGHGRFFTGIVRDITDRKKAEQALIEADRRKDEFLATLAHELRNPLAPIRNALALMRHAASDSGLMEQVRSLMERQLGHMVRLVDDLLDASRITAGKLQVRKERIELAAVIRSAVEAARPLIEASAHELTVTVPPDPIYLDADPIRLAQVFANLLTNAAKYMEKAGHIWVTAEPHDREVVVTVRDTGIGIDAEHLPRIFEMFSQVASTLERSQGGLGIGLSLVKGIVELHGGRVGVHSGGTGLGSEFAVRLPVIEASVQATRVPSDDGQPRCLSKCRILVVDDNRDTADSLSMMLRLMGHDLRTAYDGLEAVQAAATFRPHVVLLDIGLPKMNGYEAARSIRGQPWGTTMALIAVTGWGQEQDKRRALEAGFDHHLTKPVDVAVLNKQLALVNPVPWHETRDLLALEETKNGRG